ncbi:HNH endonuclease [Streptomyces sp. BK022]|uniref:HNH endonuclease signature motif containing protein n=1 Tax=Streptomyces sp. BK022 TaxID=2512123 RepID=UPI00102A57C8|nr:HNH endonuclease signature motif containing protein [Streptomyces sp. BK022]RZU35962.1 HNH endonuclease [Streptomyces sp. BK022]
MQPAEFPFVEGVHYEVAENGCWEWRLTRTPRGYGQAWDARVKKTRYAHRIAWEYANGRSLEPSEVVRHDCDNPPCIRPKDLLVGTQADNLRDMRERNRQARGDNHGRAKLTDEEVAAIRAEYTGARGEKTRLAKKYNVHKTRIGQILSGDRPTNQEN